MIMIMSCHIKYLNGPYLHTDIQAQLLLWNDTESKWPILMPEHHDLCVCARLKHVGIHLASGPMTNTALVQC